VTTRWTQVAAARDQSSPDARRALEELCTAYWRPLYLWLRRQGRASHDAQDLTQEFFARFLEKHWLSAADPDKGRFRTFLLIAFKRFLADEWDKATAQKRGGPLPPVSLDTTLAEDMVHSGIASDADSPDRNYDREWALTLLERAMTVLRHDYQAGGRAAEFDLLKEYLTAGRGEIPYDAIAARLGTSEAAARVMVHRLRKRFREALRAEVSSTVADARDVTDELRQLLGALGQ
jgi:RNA polymerase sigma-70 factor (ECF subfamily)